MSNVRNGWKTDIAEGGVSWLSTRMGKFAWKHPERQELYLASRVLADGRGDGDWLQWASDTILQHLELYDDPRQGVGSWIFDDEAELANELAERLWALVRANPFEAAERLIEDTSGNVRRAGADLVARMEVNGR